ncbi:BTB/POZ protein [Chaetomium sp. MPI-CAGE-AT-0009]|nr:BTB/POZ protein [Chaetomium sp. MPI-CAGE-AT-0009]
MELVSNSSSGSAPPELPGLTATNTPIRLQVGERRFTTSKATLTEGSGFFAVLLSGRWDNALPDGSYFIDADPALFEHILAYLRRGVFPLFFDEAKGHNHHMYAALLAEARYFQIPQLEAWLAEKRYMKAVQVKHTAEEYGEDDHSWRDVTAPANTTLQYHPRWSIKKTYLCPRGIPEHRGRPLACGRKCASARGQDPDRFDESPSVLMLVIKREVVFDAEVCMAGDDEEESTFSGDEEEPSF